MRERLRIGGATYQVDVVSNAPLRVEIRDEDGGLEQITMQQEVQSGEGRLKVGERFVPYFVSATPSHTWVTIAAHTFVFEKAKAGAGASDSGHGGFAAPMPGKVIKVNVADGEDVTEGQVLVIMEAMKMEHRIEAPSDGTVVTVNCNADDVVEQGFELLQFEAAE